MPSYNQSPAPRPLTIAVGPYTGIRDTLALAAADDQLAAELRNLYPPLPEIGAGVWSRPGFTRVGVTATLTGTATVSGGTGPYVVVGASASNTSNINIRDSGNVARTLTGTGTLFLTELQIGDVITSLNPLVVTRAGVDRFQHLGQYVATGGTLRRFAFTRFTNTVTTAVQSLITGSDGRFYKLVEWNPGNTAQTGFWTDRTSASLAATPLAVSGRIYTTSFANYWIVSDGVNRPWKMDSSFVRSNLTSLSVATYGPPATYYGKLWFIQASDRQTILWSEENDPDTGYAGTNAWTLRQTSNDLMTCVVGTNDALYVFRENSITAITGAANSDFKSAGTLDAISNTTGTRSPDAVCLVESAVWFLDTYGRPCKIEPGRGLVPLWADCARTVKDIAASDTNLAAAWARYDPALQVVFFGYRRNGSSTGAEQVLAFSARTEQCIGTWDISGTTDLAHGAILRDSGNRPTLAIAHGGTSELALYVRKQEGASGVAVDTLAASSPLPSVALTTQPLLGDPLTAKTISAVTVESQSENNAQATLRCAVKGPTDSAFSTAANMEQRTVTDGQPARATVRTDLRNVRYAQVQITADTTGSARVILGRIAVQGDQTTADFTTA